MPGGVDWSATEYEVRRSELSIKIHEDFWPENKILVPYMYNSNVWFESLTVCILKKKKKKKKTTNNNNNNNNKKQTKNTFLDSNKDKQNTSTNN